MKSNSYHQFSEYIESKYTFILSSVVADNGSVMISNNVAKLTMTKITLKRKKMSFEQNLTC